MRLPVWRRSKRTGRTTAIRLERTEASTHDPMDNRTIFSKTGKGALEISKKAIKLSSEERQALLLVDGKSSLAQMEEKLGKIPPPRLRAIFEKLIELDLIRQFVTKGGPDSIIPSAGSPSAAMQVQEITEDDLDFTALAPVASSNSVKEIEARRQAAEVAERAAREAEARRRVEADKLAREAADKKAREDALLRERARLAEEARRKADAERLARDAAEQKARAEAEARERARLAEEAKRKADAEKAAREAAERKAREEAERKAREEAERKAREEAERKAREEAERKAREEAERKAREEAERKAREEAERKAREEAERKAREEAEREAREEAERKAREEAERKAREEAERKAREEAEHKAREEAERKAREEAERKAREEAERKAREEAERTAREEAEREAREEALRRAQEEAERQVREHAAARERARQEEEATRRRLAEEKARQEAEQKAREEAERKAREQAEARERARQEEETLRRRLAEDKAREEAQRKAAEDAHRKAAEDAVRRAREDEERRRRESQAAREAQARADEEAARYTAALTPHLEAAAPPPSGMPDFDAPAPAEEARPAPMGAFANMAALEAGAAQPAAPVEEAEEATPAPAPAPDKNAEKERARREKERAKEEARARKEADKEAKRQARASRAGSGVSLPVGKIVAGVLVLVVAGAGAFIFTAGADKPAIEKALSTRLGMPVTVAEAKFSHFPAQLRLSNVAIGDIKLPQVVAIPETASLLSGEKIWKSADITGLTVDAAQARRLAALLTAEPSKSASLSLTLERVRALGVKVTGTEVPVPPFDATAAIAANGTVKQATLALPDGKAQVLLAPDEKGWSVDFESRGVTWPIGPRTVWDSLRAKGIATAQGVRLEEVVATLGAGNLRGSADLSWSAGWKLAGTIELGGVEAEALGTAIYGASPLAGAVEGKFNVSLAADALTRLFDAPQAEGSFLVSRAVIKGFDLARLLQGGDASGQTRLPELTGALAASNGRMQLRSLRGAAGVLNLNASVDVSAERALSGTVNLELGAGGARGRAALRIGGTVAEPRLSR
jgi:hypothetical protein